MQKHGLHHSMIFGPIKQKKTPPTGARGVNVKKKSKQKVGLQRLDSNQRNSGYEPDERPLLHPAIL